MVIDRLENLGRYTSLHPLFSQVIDFLKSTPDLQNLEPGKIILQGNDLWVNVDLAPAKKRADARLEAHRVYIDIQVPLTTIEEMGYTPLKECHSETAPYDAERDIIFFNSLPETYLTVKPGMFTIFFPEDAHAPAITETGVKKLIFKVKL